MPYHYDIDDVDGGIGHNFSVTEAQAAVGLVQLKKVEQFNERRRKIAFYWNEQFGQLDEIQVTAEPRVTSTSTTSTLLFSTAAPSAPRSMTSSSCSTTSRGFSR